MLSQSPFAGPSGRNYVGFHVLAYGKTAFHGIHCHAVSPKLGIRCVNAVGHGFRMGRGHLASVLTVRAAALLGVAATVLAGAGAATASVATFKTPSGNIGCLYHSSPGVPAMRHPQRSPAGARTSEGCELDWGFSLNMGRTGRAGSRVRDTALDPRAKVLRCGTSWRRGPFRCTSRTALTCRNAAGHGWFMSRQSWRRF